MDRVAMMMKQRDTVAVHFTNYIRLVSSSKRTVCLFEGEDQKYYSVRLNLIGNDLNWIGLDCGGKSNVIKLQKLISAHKTYKDYLLFAFVDRDFDEPLSVAEKSDRIYETPCYSIENLYCTDECLNDIFSVEFRFNKNASNPNLLSDALVHFKAIRDSFHEVIRPINLWIKAHRKKEKVEGFARLNLQNVNFDQIVRVEKNKISKLVLDIFIPSLFPECHPLSYSEISASNLEFHGQDSEMFFRGKYELEFVRQYLVIMKNESSKQNSEFYNPKCPVKLSFSKGNFISELSQYAYTPACLREFINNMSEQARLAIAAAR